VNLPSSVAIITNIDLEHLDYYPNLTAIEDAFQMYANRVPFYGAVILCADDARTMALAPRIVRRKVTYSLGGSADICGGIVQRGPGWTRFFVANEHGPLGEVTLHIPGDHYARNAIAAVATGLWLDIPFEQIKAGLEGWQGVGRRFEIKGDARRSLVVDDYGHHPTEIAATISAAVTSYSRRVSCSSAAPVFAHAVGGGPVRPLLRRCAQGVHIRHLSRGRKADSWRLGPHNYRAREERKQGEGGVCAVDRRQDRPRGGRSARG
jgi:UDP-N-acetylmuramate-alanine ligase